MPENILVTGGAGFIGSHLVWRSLPGFTLALLLTPLPTIPHLKSHPPAHGCWRPAGRIDGGSKVIDQET